MTNLEQAIWEYVNSNKSARQVAREFNIGKDKLTNNLKKRNLLRPKQDNSYDYSYFENIDNEHKAYWLGFIYADGCICSGKSQVLEIGLAYTDIAHLEKFKKDIKFQGNVKTKEGKYKSCRLRLFGTKINDDLIKLGATPRKTNNITFPYQIPKTLYRHFIRGFYDGDGSLYISKGKVSISILGTQSFLESIQDIFIEELNITKIKIYDHKNIKEYKKSRKTALKILDYLYKDSTIYLDRKYNKYALLTRSLEEC